MVSHHHGCCCSECNAVVQPTSCIENPQPVPFGCNECPEFLRMTVVGLCLTDSNNLVLCGAPLSFELLMTKHATKCRWDWEHDLSLQLCGKLLAGDSVLLNGASIVRNIIENIWIASLRLFIFAGNIPDHDQTGVWTRPAGPGECENITGAYDICQWNTVPAGGTTVKVDPGTFIISEL